jgi:hypothetical protein
MQAHKLCGDVDSVSAAQIKIIVRDTALLHKTLQRHLSKVRPQRHLQCLQLELEGRMGGPQRRSH